MNFCLNFCQKTMLYFSFLLGSLKPCCAKTKSKRETKSVLERMAFLRTPISGQVVVGGLDNGVMPLSSVELFPTSGACSIPDLPQPRALPSLSLLPGGRVVVCGGFSALHNFGSCISWAAGNNSWTHLYNMRCLQIMPSDHL